MNAPENIEFENGRPVPAVDFDYSALDSHEREVALETIRLAKEETLSRLFTLLLDDGADATEVGLRVHLLAFCRGMHPAKSQRQLAAQLKISQGTVSKGITKIVNGSNGFASFLRALRNHSAH